MLGMIIVQKRVSFYTKQISDFTRGEEYMKKNNYYVIGGQYRYCNYGGTETLLGAKRLATKNEEFEEFWDNWQGWNKPKIYRAEDCECHDGYYYPVFGAMPVAVWNKYDGKWETRCQ